MVFLQQMEANVEHNNGYRYNILMGRGLVAKSQDQPAAAASYYIQGAAVCHPRADGLVICGQHQLLPRPALHGHPSPRLRHPATQEKRGVGPPHQPRRVSGRDDAPPRTSLRRAGRRHAGLGLPHGVCQPDGEAPLRRRAQRHEEHTVYLRRQQKRQYHQPAHAAADLRQPADTHLARWLLALAIALP